MTAVGRRWVVWGGSYRGGGPAGLRAGVLAQTVTLGLLGGLGATGGPHGALHLVLQVQVAALGTEEEEE